MNMFLNWYIIVIPLAFTITSTLQNTEISNLAHSTHLTEIWIHWYYIIYNVIEVMWWCRNGDTYAGEYFADKMHGFGVYRFANGHRYEGAWHEGRRQGCGMYTFRNGETQSGQWDNGVISVSTSQNPFLSSVSHAKVLKAVQVRIHTHSFHI